MLDYSQLHHMIYYDAVSSRLVQVSDISYHVIYIGYLEAQFFIWQP